MAEEEHNPMATIRFTAEDIRNPEDSERLLLHTEDATDCYGEICGQYYEGEDGEPLKPSPHSHLVGTGQNPGTTPRCVPISK
jgi:hypothetical protein